ncbi:hypothetical protein AC1031_006218 [Aphanomyces cochlioides]|nr:hypothetical protein AC1031_006218 [Aphanomyces cochlioides]
MPKVSYRPTVQPTFGLISERSHAHHDSTAMAVVKRESLSPHRRLQTNLGQRFVCMLATVEHIAHLNVDDEHGSHHNDSHHENKKADSASAAVAVAALPRPQDEIDPPSIPRRMSVPTEHLASLRPPPRRSMPSIVPPATTIPTTTKKKRKKRRKKRIKRTWKTSHATWTRHATTSECQTLERPSSLRKLDILHKLNDLKPIASVVASRRYIATISTSPDLVLGGADDDLSEPSSESGESVHDQDAPMEPPKIAALEESPARKITINMRLTVDPPRPPSPPRQRDEVVHGLKTPTADDKPTKPCKLNHVATFITPEMTVWLKKCGMFKVKPKRDVVLTMEDQVKQIKRPAALTH